MTSDRYQKMFSRADAEGRGVFIPFVVVGDPNLETSLQVIQTLIDAGADGLELGIPFSDPVADGPVIQAAVVRALENGATPNSCYDVIASVRKNNPEIPIGILTYCNPVMRDGYTAYFKNIARAKIDSVLVADMPVGEADAYIEAATAAHIYPVFIAPPNADEKTAAKIAASTKGYTYVVTRKGVTGTDENLATTFSSTISKLIKLGAPRPVVGFGISKPAHVAASIAAGAAGAISGSAVVKILEQYMDDSESRKSALTSFVQEMKAATQRTEK